MCIVENEMFILPDLLNAVTIQHIWNEMKKFHFSSSTSMNFIDCESSGNHKIPIFFYILLVTVELYDCVIKKGVGTSGT